MALAIVAVGMLFLWYVVWSSVAGRNTGLFQPDPPPSPPAGPSDAGGELVDTEATLAEAALAARLVSGQLLPAEYQRAMARLAADDAASRPTVVPPSS